MRKLILSILGFFTVALTSGKEYFNETKSRLNSHLDNMHTRATQLQHFEEFEEFESLEGEYMENIERNKNRGMAHEMAVKKAHATMSAKHGNKFHKALSNSAVKGSTMITSNPHKQMIASFDIVIVRKTHAITSSIPVALFATMHYYSKYVQIVNTYLPSGVTLSATTVQTDGSIDFTYTDGTNTDIVNVKCNQIPYISFLVASATTPFHISKIRYTLADSSQLAQFSETFAVVSKSIFGKADSDTISVTNEKSPMQYQNGIIDLDYGLKFDLENGAVINTANLANNLTFTLSFRVNRYNKVTTHA